MTYRHAQGFAELDRKFALLERIADPAEIKAALRAGARVIGDEERRLAPRRTGTLASAIVETMTPNNVELPRDDRTIYIGPLAKLGAVDLYYAYLVERGTVHSAPQAFVRGAVAGKGPDALTVVTDTLARAVRRAAA